MHTIAGTPHTKLLTAELILAIVSIDNLLTLISPFRILHEALKQRRGRLPWKIKTEDIMHTKYLHHILCPCT